MKPRMLLLRLLFALFIVNSAFVAWAQKDGGVVKTPLISNMSGDSLATANTYAISQSYIPATGGWELSPSITNIISLVVNEETNTYLSADFTATVVVNIQYGKAGYAENSKQVSLTVTYSKSEGAKYNARNYFSFKGANFVRVTVATPSTATVGGVSVNKFIRLQNEMRVTSYYKLNATKIPVITQLPATADELPLTWQTPVDAGNNGVQLEWTWLEDELKSTFYDSGDTVNPKLLFRRNATRIDLPAGKSSYNIPLFYDGQGKLYYHIRAVNNDATGKRTDGNWSDLQSYIFKGHNDSLNWQVSTSFAEEGKRKSVIEYFDGSLRGRQTVTKDNSTNNVIAAETFYDAMGRPAVQVLPVPGINSVVAYTKNLNLFNNQASFEDPAKYFDLESTSFPGSATPVMKPDSSVAALYYSSGNADKNSNSNSNIPSAEGYPYSVTRYTPDATGRILSQSGVGAAMKMGSGHEIKYYYGTPAQEELDGLFGTEAGDFTHYAKNMVKDANGQMSVSYVDMTGKTVATALAGEAPVGVKALLPDNTQYPNQYATYITRNLLNNNANLIKGHSVESVTSLLVPAKGVYNFNYALTPAALLLTSCQGQQLNYDCKYTLEITVIDESGDHAPIVRRFNNITVNLEDTSATVAEFKDESGVPSNNITFSYTFEPGSYLVRKTLSISDASLQKYKELFVSKGVCKTQDQLIDSVYTVMRAGSACGGATAITCQSCMDSLGSYNIYRNKYIQNLGSNLPSESAIHAAYSADSLNCKALCGNTSHRLESIRSMMLADMTPYTGQYATGNPPASYSSDILYYQYDIFSTLPNNGLHPFYKYPWTTDSIRTYYRDAYDSIDRSIHPDTGALYNVLDTLSASGFASRFTSSWAEALLPHHPEYGRLNFAEKHLKRTYDWIEAFNQDSTYAQAASNGHIVSSGSFLVSVFLDHQDPFFDDAFSPSNIRTMDSIVNRSGYYKTNLWNIAYTSVICNNIADANSRANCESGSHKPPFADLTDDQRNSVWNVFKGLYSNVRDSMVNAWIRTKVPISNETSFAAQNYALRFASNSLLVAQTDGWSSWYPATSGGAPAVSMPDSAAAVYTNRCSSYIDGWKTKLLQCAAIASMADTARARLLNKITAGMEAVCRKGTDEANPNGSSSVAPSTAYDGQPRTFEEVILKELTDAGIPRNLFCNAFVIDFPKPYGKNPVLVQSYIARLDTCTCSRYAALVQEANNTPGYSGYTMTNLNKYLKQAYGDTLTAVVYAGLQHCSELVTRVGCDSTIDSGPSTRASTGTNCRDTVVTYGLSSAQPLPAFLKCGYVNISRCVTCDTLSALTGRFKTYFANTPFTGAPYLNDDLDTTQIACNALFARYLNYYTGLELTWMDYVKAAATSSCSLANYAANSNAHQTVICGSTKIITDTAGKFVVESPCDKVQTQATSLAINIYEAQREQLLANFEVLYLAKCLEAKNAEVFMVSDTSREYHYTLYYYDQAGNLVKTVPPKGVRPDFSTTFLNRVKTARSMGDTALPVHSFLTQYRYNSLNQLVAQKSPDAGISSFWYDRLGRLAVSRNAQQQADARSLYSYTIYDALGRITEVGQKPATSAMLQTISQDTAALYNWLYNTGGTREQVTGTVYDIARGGFDTLMSQKNLRNRVSYSYTQNLATEAPYYTSATFYSYDVHGNVDTLVQDYKGISIANNSNNRFKRITYQYDLISGKVNGVDYQPGFADNFYHRYTYDAENRLTEVETSRDKLYWEREAAYSYYKHGPVSRVVFGQQQVQGVDYAYTLQGWLKSVNSGISTGNGFDSVCISGSAVDSLIVNQRSGNTPGSYTARFKISFTGEFESGVNDSFVAVVDSTLAVCKNNGNAGGLLTTSEAATVANDIFGFNLHYYPGDYLPIGGSVATSVLNALGTEAAPLYNGNIAAMAVAIPKLGDAKLYNYHYDQLNRLVQMDAYNGINTTTGTFTPIKLNDYKERISYDPNGNIQSYLRNGVTTNGIYPAMDSLTYDYYANNNRLKHIGDNTTYTNNYSTDIDNQVAANNYTYDSIGNLKSDAAEGITDIQWTVYGKIASITKNGNTISYTYDASGNRISKNAGDVTTFYVRDASGNVMAVYEQTASTNTLQQTENHIYGSSRLGIQKQLTVAAQPVALASGFGSGTNSIFTRGEKLFELSNHLGNVLATVSDKRLQVSAAGSTVDYYNADVVSAQDYYPFGMLQPGRSYNAGGYRYGFNGKENDNEVKGDGNQQDYGMRIYDPRIGKFLSVDPITKDYPELTPYQFASNRPIQGVDLDGGEFQDRATNVAYWMKRHPVQTTIRESLLSGMVDLRNVRDASLYLGGGQVMPKRNWAWDLLAGPRVFSGYAGNGKLYINNIVDADGYVTNRTVPIGGTAPLPDGIGSPFGRISHFSQLGFRYEAAVKTSEDGSRFISHFLRHGSQKILIGYSSISAEGLLSNAFEVHELLQGLGASKAMYAELKIIGFSKVESSFNPSSTNFQEFMKIYDASKGNLVEAAKATPAAKALGEGWTPTNFNVTESNIKMEWIKK
ncbi:YD repeat-containing protein [Filimonas lacunae]|uniref:YD repeat-containing protein n=1 Tax=Filimonas lacunae TaxID=477680 RepID=A0A173MF84_9BACT|nr:RHS repeat-associated core domain-containing protein [Filimonas lacunae]BAV06167.1 cell well associated RhsD protein [Filimonas lacunae]SIT25042.1 YD repeat-containing protein [Filimonas lacunae]